MNYEPWTINSELSIEITPSLKKKQEGSKNERNEWGGYFPWCSKWEEYISPVWE
jgi:hypothetical protein